MSARAKKVPALAPTAMPVLAVGSHADGSVPTIESMRLLGAKQAGVWVNNIEEMRDLSPLMPWRDNCRDEIRDELDGLAERHDLLGVWSRAFDDKVDEELAALCGTISDSRDDIDCAIAVIRDLLRLAINEGVRFEPAGNIANAPLHAATRYLDDIAKSAAFIDDQIAEKGGAA